MKSRTVTFLAFGLLGVLPLSFGEETDARSLERGEDRGLSRMEKAISDLGGSNLPSLRGQADATRNRVSNKTEELAKIDRDLQALARERAQVPARFASKPELMQMAQKNLDHKIASLESRKQKVQGGLAGANEELGKQEASIRVEELISETSSEDEKVRQIQREHETRVAQRFSEAKDLLETCPVGRSE